MDSRRRPGDGRRGIGPLIAGVFGILAVACMLSVFYVHELKATMQEETDRYLEEIAQHVAALVNDRVETSFRTLETVAEEWDIEDWSEANISRLQRIAECNGFDRIGVVDLTGHVRTSDGYQRDISASEAVRAALSGARGISDYVISGENEEGHMLYTVPLFKNGAVAGAVSASVGKDQMRGLVSGESFGGEGFSHIVDSHGDVVVDSGHENAVKAVENFFAMLETRGTLEQGCSLDVVKADMASGRGGLLYATVDGVGRAMYYAKLDVEDWYVLSVVPTAVTTAKTAPSIHLAMLINAAIMLLMLALTWVILMMDRRSRRELEQLALMDPVTGGMNRTCFERAARRAIDSAPSGSWVLVSLDIRHFKLINDAFTSEQGNRALKHLHDVISRHLSGEEAVGRVSGDIFSVLLRRRSRGLTMAWLEEVAEDLNSFNEGQERQYYLSLAAGVYEVDEPELDMITIQDRANVARKKREAIKVGDLATCVFYTDVERLKLLREKEIDDRKETALVNHEFLVYLQPKVSLATGAVAGAEALVRWRDPERGLVAPDEFVPAFERNGFITRLDIYVFEEVCKILRQWMDRGWQPLPISVNLSGSICKTRISCGSSRRCRAGTMCLRSSLNLSLRRRWRRKIWKG